MDKYKDSIPVRIGREESGSESGQVNFEAKALEIEENMDKDLSPGEMDCLPAEHPLWLLIGLCQGIYRGMKKSEGGNSAEIAGESLKKIEDSLDKGFRSMEDRMEKSRGAGLSGKLIPVGLLLLALGLFGASLWAGKMVPSPQVAAQGLTVKETEAALRLKGILEDMAFCRGEHFVMVGEYCTYKPVVRDGVLVTPGWKVKK